MIKTKAKSEKNKFKLSYAVFFALKTIFKQQPGLIITEIIIRIFYSAATAVNIWIFSKVVQELTLLSSAAFNLNKVLTYFFIWLGLLLFAKVANCINDFIKEKMQVYNELHLQRKQIEKINKIKFITLKTPEFKQATRMANKGSYTVMALAYYFFSLFQAIVTSIASLLVLFAFHYSLPLILIAASLPLCFIAFNFQKSMYSIEWWNQKDGTKLDSYEHALDEKKALPEVRNYNASTLFLDKWKIINKTINERHIKHIKKEGSLVFAQSLLSAIFVLGTIIFALWLTLNGYILAGAFVATLAAINDFKNELEIIVDELGWMYSQAKRFNDFIVFTKMEEEQSGDITLNGFKNELKLTNAIFKYPKPKNKKEAPVIINNLNLTIKKGERIAIVGENGSGKSTLLNIILGLYELESGDFTVDGVSIKDIKIDSYKELLTIVHQSFACYNSFEVRENIGIANITKLNETDLLNTALIKGESVHSSNTILINEGLNKKVGKEFEGLEFSGGEWQKLALSRSFFKSDAKIYIMDEPTSALDAIVENKVLNNFITETKDKTAIIISHRLSLCKKVDRIVFMEKGKIVEQGSHLQLMKQNGKYAQMFKNQQKWYE